jgi:hypothetical protein
VRVGRNIIEMKKHQVANIIRPPGILKEHVPTNIIEEQTSILQMKEDIGSVAEVRVLPTSSVDKNRKIRKETPIAVII